MAAYHSDEILDASTLPLRYAAFSPCFRKEAGSHGKDTRGIFRVHWFDKVEMFVYTTLEESYAEHQRLLAWEKEFLDKLELCYRVIDVAAGDLGLSAQRKFDCEAWIASQGRYRLSVKGEAGHAGTVPMALRHDALAAAAEAVTRIADLTDAVPDDVWNEAVRHYDEKARSGLLLQIAQINVWNRLNASVRQVAGAAWN